MRTVIIGEPLLKLQSVDSTNNYAAALLHKGTVIEGTVILAGHQTEGKGQGGNRWISEEYSNLLCSVILQPDFLMAERQFYLSMCISIGLVDFIRTITKSVCIKWPNDIMLDQKKVAGILIENTVIGQNLNTAVIGIGLNVNQKVFPPDLPNPTSLSLKAGHDHNVSEVLNGIINCLNPRINMLYAEDYSKIKNNYLNNLWLLNEWARYTDQSGIFEGRIVDIAETGELVVMVRNGTVKQYGFKEITFLH